MTTHKSWVARRRRRNEEVKVKNAMDPSCSALEATTSVAHASVFTYHLLGLAFCVPINIVS
jgi:hypothetical protein